MAARYSTNARRNLNAKFRRSIIRDRKDPMRKQGNDQTVPLLPDAWTIVTGRIEERPTGRLFPFNAEFVSTAFTRACKACGI